MLELEHVPSASNVLDGLAGLGLAAVDSSTTSDGLQAGPAGCVLGQFRATDPSALEHQLRVDIASRLRRMQVDAAFRVFVQPLEMESAEVIPLHAFRRR